MRAAVIANRFFIRIGLFAFGSEGQTIVKCGLRDKDRETHLKFPSMLAGKILFFIDANRRFIER
ncbi:MAG TPA: hypothetical protein DEA66_07585 [Flavobacteriales bacterium]|nr:hypothetical protein [Flavobacteriales bacterium]HCL47289.1 hypothetical protein [Flavobacteriales bacterium]